jgi:DNA polymerase-1
VNDVYNPYKEWKRYHLDHLEDMKYLFLVDNPKTGGADTETTGLHIKKDKAFLIVFGWLVPGQTGGKVFTFYPTQENMKIFFELAKKLKYFVFHNTKYDLHMMRNAGFEYDGDNLCENMALARLTLEAIPERDGGDSLALKHLGKTYVHPEANKSEKLIKEELKRLNGERIKFLTAALKQFDHPTEKTSKGTPKKWGKGLIETFLKDPTHDAEDLPEDVKDVWLDWQEEYPSPTYEDIDRELMIKYAGEDVITMLEFFKKSWPTLIQREQLNV